MAGPSTRACARSARRWGSSPAQSPRRARTPLRPRQLPSVVRTGWPPTAPDARRAPAAPAPVPAKPAPKGPSKNRQKDQARLEAAIEQAETALATVEDELADPAAWATPYESAKSTARHTAARRAVEDAYAALEAFEERSAESAQA